MIDGRKGKRTPGNSTKGVAYPIIRDNSDFDQTKTRIYLAIQEGNLPRYVQPTGNKVNG